MNQFEREQERKQKEFEERNADRIKAYNDNYWNNLEYHAVLMSTKEEEERYLQEELEYLRKLKEQFPKRRMI